MIFNDVIGNEKNKKLLQNIINSNNIAHSYMFIGQESIGKLLFAKEFSKAILCLNDTKPCNKCKSCIEFNTCNNPDFNILEPNGSSIKIEQIRNLIENIYEKPIVSNKKVYIINDSNLMTKEAQNALLKTLEEPPEYVTIILIASNDNLFLPTIKSRCTKILFNKLNNNELIEILQKKYNYNNISNLVIEASNGSVKRAVNLKEKEAEYVKVNNVFNKLETIDLLDLLATKEDIFFNKEETIEILEYINLIFFNKIKSDSKYIKCMQIIEDTKDRLNKNNNFDMAIDNFIMTVWEEING